MGNGDKAELLSGPMRAPRLPFTIILAACAGLAAPGCGPSDAPDLTSQANGDEAPRKVLVCLGDSITAGYGLDPSEAYPALLQLEVDDAGLPWRVVAAGVSGDTTSGGLRRLDWAFKSGVDALLIALGGNDGLRGIDPRTVRKNLVAIAEAAHAQNPDATIVIAGMKAPPNMGAKYCDEFESVFAEAAEETGAVLIPFLLEGVGGDRALNQRDGIHPTAEGQRILADHLWTALRPIIE